GLHIQLVTPARNRIVKIFPYIVFIGEQKIIITFLEELFYFLVPSIFYPYRANCPLLGPKIVIQVHPPTKHKGKMIGKIIVEVYIAEQMMFVLCFGIFKL